MNTPGTHGLQDQPDPPALAASVVGAVRTENARLAEIRQRAEAATTSPERSHIWQDARDVPALLDLVDELIAQRDLARDAAVALEQELAERGRCGDLAPTLAGGDALPVCDLPAGHEGWHKADDGCEWTHGAARRVGVQEQT